MGNRDNESGDRKRSMQKHFGEEFYGHHPVGSIRTASPIRDWTSQEVVTFLAFNRARLGAVTARATPSSWRSTELLQATNVHLARPS